MPFSALSLNECSVISLPLGLQRSIYFFKVLISIFYRCIRVLQVKEFILIFIIFFFSFFSLLKIIELVVTILLPDVLVVTFDAKVLVVALAWRLILNRLLFLIHCDHMGLERFKSVLIFRKKIRHHLPIFVILF